MRRFGGKYLSSGEAAKAGIGKAAISMPMLRSLFTERAIDVLHVHTHNRFASALVGVAKLRRIPVAITLHSEFKNLRPRWRYWFPNEMAIRLADVVIAVNQAIPRSLAEYGVRTRGVVSIPHGVDVVKFARGNGKSFRKALGISGQPLILTPGRICDVKNQRVILDAVAALKERNIQVRWLIVGVPSEADYFESLERGIIERDLSEDVLLVPGYPPESEELVNAYAAADVVVVPSKHEAFGLVVLEAWSAEKPVIATLVGGLPEVIDDGENGRLVPPGDTAALVEAVADLLNDAQERSRLGKAGFSKAKIYDWAKVGARIASVYSEIGKK